MIISRSSSIMRCIAAPPAKSFPDRVVSENKVFELVPVLRLP